MEFQTYKAFLRTKFSPTFNGFFSVLSNELINSSGREGEGLRHGENDGKPRLRCEQTGLIDSQAANNSNGGKLLSIIVIFKI